MPISVLDNGIGIPSSSCVESSSEPSIPGVVVRLPQVPARKGEHPLLTKRWLLHYAGIGLTSVRRTSLGRRGGPSLLLVCCEGSTVNAAAFETKSGFRVENQPGAASLYAIGVCFNRRSE